VFLRPSDSVVYHTNVSQTISNAVCLNGSCYASCAANIEKTLTSTAERADSLGRGMSMTPPDLSKPPSVRCSALYMYIIA